MAFFHKYHYFSSRMPFNLIARICFEKSAQAARAFVKPAEKEAGAIPFNTSGLPAGIDGWANLSTPTCTVSNNSNWKKMSIVDGLSDATFSYPSANMTGWICSYNTPMNNSCGKTPPPPNNTPAEGDYYYSQVTAHHLTVYRVDRCPGPESVRDGVVPALSCLNGKAMVEQDMDNNCAAQTR